MPLRSVLIPVLWVGVDNPFQYFHPIVGALLKVQYANQDTRDFGALVEIFQEMYGLSEPEDLLADQLYDQGSTDESVAWFNHLPLFESTYAAHY